MEGVDYKKLFERQLGGFDHKVTSELKFNRQLARPDLAPPDMSCQCIHRRWERPNLESNFVAHMLGILGILGRGSWQLDLLKAMIQLSDNLNTPGTTLCPPPQEYDELLQVTERIIKSYNPLTITLTTRIHIYIYIYIQIDR